MPPPLLTPLLILFRFDDVDYFTPFRHYAIDAIADSCHYVAAFAAYTLRCEMPPPLYATAAAFVPPRCAAADTLMMPLPSRLRRDSCHDTTAYRPCRCLITLLRFAA